jgi:hypothetical protein
MKPLARKVPYHLPALLLLAGLFLLYLRRTGPFTAPLAGVGDTEHLEWVPFLFGKLLHFSPFPQLTLFQDWVVYPSGGTVTYLPFSWESNFFCAAAMRLFGPGPWSYAYFFLTHAGLFLAAGFLLEKIQTPRVAWMVAFLLAFFNFYAQNKFPRHANMAYCHWLILTLVYLYTLLVLVEQKSQAPLKRLIGWGPVILLASAGQDPGYVIPFCLTLWSVAALAVLSMPKSRHFLWETLRALKIKEAIGSRRGMSLAMLCALLFFFTFR